VGLTSIQKANLEKAAKAAWESQQIAPFPGLLTLAQWALESGWGTKQPGNNCFGIKAYPNCYAVQYLNTWEGEYRNGRKVISKQPFAIFETLEDAFLKHNALLVTSPTYQPLFLRYRRGESTLPQLAQDIAGYWDAAGTYHSRYAKDEDYAEKLIRIMQMSEVQSAWKAVAGERAA
jgi:flagellum-specific peptidoglycan hydrolase FlgJ